MEGEEGVDSDSGGRATSGGVAALARARGEGEMEELLVDLWRGGERGVRGEDRARPRLKKHFFLCRVSWIWALDKVFFSFFSFHRKTIFFFC